MLPAGLKTNRKAAAAPEARGMAVLRQLAGKRVSVAQTAARRCAVTPVAVAVSGMLRSWEWVGWARGWVQLGPVNILLVARHFCIGRVMLSSVAQRAGTNLVCK